jgi:lysophospholipase L1-like esterase
MLDQSIARFRELALARSDAPPLFLILPLMVDFRTYPLRAAHERLQALARRRGFEVLDLLPLFTERLVDGNRHLAAPNDNHFDAATHALVANALHDALRATPPRR